MITLLGHPVMMGGLRGVERGDALGAYLNIGQILVSVTIVLIILLQVKEGGSGLFGSAQSSVRTRRGLEKTLFQFTIIVAAVFLGISVLSVRFG